MCVHTQHLLTCTRMNTCSVHVLYLKDNIVCFHFLLRELKAIRRQLQSILGPSAMQDRGMGDGGEPLEREEEGGADMFSLVSITHVMITQCQCTE